MIRKIGLRKLLVLLCCGLIVLTVSAAERYAGEFLLAVESPRARAMGGIGALLPGGGFAVARNPAWLADIPSVDVSLLHTDRFAGIVRNDFVGVASPGKNGGVGFALYRTGVENIPYTRLIDPSLPQSGANRVIVDRYESDQEWAGWVGIGRKFNEQWQYGASLKPIWKQLGGGTAIGFGCDAGVVYRPLKQVTTALAVSDLVTSPLRWNTSRSELIKPRLQAGATYGFSNKRMHAEILLAGAVEVRSDEGGSNLLSGHGGVEYVIDKVVALRGGYDKDRPVFGAGIKTHRVDFDYAYRDEPLGVVHMIGVNYRID